MSCVDWRQILYINEQVQTIINNPILSTDQKQEELAVLSQQLKSSTGYVVDNNGKYRSETGQSYVEPTLKKTETKKPKKRSRPSGIFQVEKKECAWCGATDSPQFRSGPQNSILCNQHGLQYRKTQMEKKSHRQQCTTIHRIAIKNLIN